MNEFSRSPIYELFDERQIIKDVSGSGNNWLLKHNDR